MARINLAMGCLSPAIVEQLRLQGVVPKWPESFQSLQEDADAISRLSVRGFLTARETDTARKRLMREIVKSVYTLNTTGAPPTRGDDR